MNTQITAVMVLVVLSFFWSQGRAQQLEIQPLPGGEVVPALEAGMQSLREIVTEEMVRDHIERWEQATRVYYQTLYDAPVTVSVDDDAAAVLSDTFVSSQVSSQLIQTAGVERLRAVAIHDIYTLLDSSFFVSEGYGDFVSEAVEGRPFEFVVRDVDVKRALSNRDCRILPCDRRKCGDQCAEETVRRIFPAISIDE